MTYQYHLSDSYVLWAHYESEPQGAAASIASSIPSDDLPIHVFGKLAGGAQLRYINSHLYTHDVHGHCTAKYKPGATVLASTTTVDEPDSGYSADIHPARLLVDCATGAASDTKYGGAEPSRRVLLLPVDSLDALPLLKQVLAERVAELAAFGHTILYDASNSSVSTIFNDQWLSDYEPSATEDYNVHKTVQSVICCTDKRLLGVYLQRIFGSCAPPVPPSSRTLSVPRCVATMSHQISSLAHSTTPLCTGGAWTISRTAGDSNVKLSPKTTAVAILVKGAGDEAAEGASGATLPEELWPHRDLFVDIMSSNDRSTALEVLHTPHDGVAKTTGDDRIAAISVQFCRLLQTMLTQLSVDYPLYTHLPPVRDAPSHVHQALYPRAPLPHRMLTLPAQSHIDMSKN